MDAVRPTDAERVGELPRPADQRIPVRPRSSRDDLPSLPQLQGERGVEDVRGGQSIVEPATLIPDRVRDDVNEGRDVVAGGPLALLHGLDA